MKANPEQDRTQVVVARLKEPWHYYCAVRACAQPLQSGGWVVVLNTGAVPRVLATVVVCCDKRYGVPRLFAAQASASAVATEVARRSVHQSTWLPLDTPQYRLVLEAVTPPADP
jgi:hypothetical protein